MIAEASRDIKSTIAAAMWTTAWGGIVAALGLVSLVLFTTALLIWLSSVYDELTSCLIVGTIYLLSAGAALIAFLKSRQRTRDRARQIAAVRKSAWLEPAVVATGLEIARALGGKRVSMLIAGAFALSWLIGHVRTPTPTTGQRRPARTRDRDVA